MLAIRGGAGNAKAAHIFGILMMIFIIKRLLPDRIPSIIYNTMAMTFGMLEGAYAEHRP